ncbi:hypothetical protein [Sulfuricurvum sp.]|uniref:hypothetical protein n=1 Tax=Sulfuricurvum sp. TaxID=2025608 RepID=UPI002600BD0E|nr:hypothetical protein [Sulfuricurvum sp.]
MKKVLSIALILGATALMACPMQNGGMMKDSGMMMKKCECDTSKLPKPFEKLGLNDDQKAQIQKIREEGKAFHNQQREKMMAVLTPEQLKTFEANAPKMCPKQMPMKMQAKMPEGGMGCKECDKK